MLLYNTTATTKRIPVKSSIAYGINDAHEPKRTKTLSLLPRAKTTTQESPIVLAGVGCLMMQYLCAGHLHLKATGREDADSFVEQMNLIETDWAPVMKIKDAANVIRRAISISISENRFVDVSSISADDKKSATQPKLGDVKSPQPNKG